MSAKHTQAPLAIDGDDIYGRTGELAGVYLAAIFSGKNEGRVAAAFANCLVKSDEECRANAARIMLTWNAHDDLVAALQTCKDVLRANKIETGLHYPHAEEAIAAALAKAGVA